MTDELSTEATPAGHARKYDPRAYGKGPIVAGGALAALLIPALILGGIGAASALTVRSDSKSAHQTETPSTSGPGNEVTGTDDPSTPPDRDSDQIVPTPPVDEIYYIQEGDTLTALSAQFGLSIDYIADYNAVRDVNVISEGAVLRMPFIYVPPTEAAPVVPEVTDLEG